MDNNARKERNAYAKAWREKNKEHLHGYMKEWRDNNKDKIQEYQDRYWGKKSQEL